MKKIVLAFSLTAFCILQSGNSFAQVRTEGTKEVRDSLGRPRTVTYTEIRNDETTPKRTEMIAINPFKFILFWNISFYHSFNSVVAAGLGFQTPTLASVKGYGLNGEVRFYPSKKSLAGFYVAPNVSWNHLSSASGDNSSGTNVGVTSSSVGFLLGWQWFIGDDFGIGLGLGLDHYFLSGAIDETVFASFNGTLPAFRLEIGYAW